MEKYIPERITFNIPVNKKFAFTNDISYWFDLKNSGIEPWLEINVGEYKKSWFIPNYDFSSVSFYNEEDATAFKLVFG